jgi:electron transport complex protein RnfC
MRLKQILAPASLKRATENQPIEPMPAPKEIIMPLLQHTGAPARARVARGDKVKVGSLVAQANGYVSSPIHSSVSGQVREIKLKPHPLLGEYQAVVIESDGEDTLDAAIQERKDIASLSPGDIRTIIQNSGIVGLGGAAFPTHVKLTPPRDKPIESFILNSAECEPYLTADYRLMLEKAGQIILGMKIAMKVLAVGRGFIAVEDNKPRAIEIFDKLVKREAIKVVTLKSFYPQGAEKQLIKAILNREVPPAGLPFDVGVVVNNAATCFSIYEAVYKNKPLYERVITLSGKIVKHPANLLVRIGTKVRDVIDFCGGLNEEAAKVILGGPMMGIAQYTLDVPVIKGTSGILVFSKHQTRPPRPQACIRCGRCMQLCPMGLNPSGLAQAIEKGRFDLAKDYHLLDCIECGLCRYTCPGNRDIVGLVKLAKEKLK